MEGFNAGRNHRNHALTQTDQHQRLVETHLLKTIHSITISVCST